MKVEEHKSFKKYYRKLSVKQKFLYKQRISLLSENPNHPLLKLHSLKGLLDGFCAFALGGDLRVVFKWMNKRHIVLYKIGTHNQVY